MIQRRSSRSRMAALTFMLSSVVSGTTVLAQRPITLSIPDKIEELPTLRSTRHKVNLPATPTSTATSQNLTYHHGAIIHHWKGRFYTAWHATTGGEHSYPYEGLVSWSPDGANWMPATHFTSPANDAAYEAFVRAHDPEIGPGAVTVSTVPRALYSNGDTLYLWCLGWVLQGDKRSWAGRIFYTDDGNTWKEIAPQTLKDLKDNQGLLVYNTASNRSFIPLNDGRWMAASLEGGYAPITSDPTLLTGWNAGSIDASDCDDVGEPGGWQDKDGVLHYVARYDFNVWHSSSSDGGQTWTKLAPQRGFLDSPGNKEFGKLPDGRIWYVGNPVVGTRDYLVLSLSNNGWDFNQSYIVRWEPMRQLYTDPFKGSVGYQYPSATYANGKLYIAYSVARDNIEVSIVDINPNVVTIPASRLAFEDFGSNPGWSSSALSGGGYSENMSWSNTSLSGGAPGEARGWFRRIFSPQGDNKTATYYADANIGTLDPTTGLYASWKMTDLGGAEDLGGGALIGFFKKSDVAGIGIRYNENTWEPQLWSHTGYAAPASTAGTGTNVLTFGSDYYFTLTFTYTPTQSILYVECYSQANALTPVGTRTYTYNNLDVSSMGLNAFGFHKRNFSGDSPAATICIYMDDAVYTVVAPPTLYEDFRTNPGWASAALSAENYSESMAWSNTANASGSTGEARGLFRRIFSPQGDNKVGTYYADTDLGGTLNAKLGLNATWKLKRTDAEGAGDLGGGALVGFFKVSDKAGIGVGYNENGWQPQLWKNGGSVDPTEVSRDGSNGIQSGMDYFFKMSFTYTPARSILTVKCFAQNDPVKPLGQIIYTYENLDISTLGLNAFGLYKRNYSGNDITQSMDLYLDDASYTVVAPRTKLERFTTSPVWSAKALVSGQYSEVMGPSNTSNAGGTTGEAKGLFRRIFSPQGDSKFGTYYADTRLGGALNAKLGLSGAWKMTNTGGSADLGGGALIGYFKKTDKAGIGIRYNTNDWAPQVWNNNGYVAPSSTSWTGSKTLDVGKDYFFKMTFSYTRARSTVIAKCYTQDDLINPKGTMTYTYDGLDVSAMGLDSFGFHKRNFTGDAPTSFLTLYMDDAVYNFRHDAGYMIAP